MQAIPATSPMPAAAVVGPGTALGPAPGVFGKALALLLADASPALRSAAGDACAALPASGQQQAPGTAGSQIPRSTDTPSVAAADAAAAAAPSSPTEATALPAPPLPPVAVPATEVPATAVPGIAATAVPGIAATAVPGTAPAAVPGTAAAAVPGTAAAAVPGTAAAAVPDAKTPLSHPVCKARRGAATGATTTDSTPDANAPIATLASVTIPLAVDAPPPANPPQPPSGLPPAAAAAPLRPVLPDAQPSADQAPQRPDGPQAAEPAPEPQSRPARLLPGTQTAGPPRQPASPADPQPQPEAAPASGAAPTQAVAPATAKASAPAAPASPTGQLAPALVSIAHASNGAQRLTVRLEPAELGHVEIRVDRAAGAPVRVEITVQRPETLTLLLRDQPQLQRTLDQAGLPPDGRSLTFHVAAPEPAGSAQGSGAAGSIGGGAGGGANPGFTGQQTGQSRWGVAPDDEPSDGGQPPLTRWLRAGLDITA